MWDATQYLKFANERSRPFFDLLTRVQAEGVRRVADLGCGPGNLTRTLAERWPDACVLGVDHSAEMLEQAQPLTIPGRLEFVQADVASWTPETPFDLVVSNAAFQWVNDHARLLEHLKRMLASDGTLAVQMPYHFQDPAHLAIEATKSDPRWRAALEGVGLHQQSVMPIAWYVDRLHELGFAVDAWQTTYIHVLTGPDPVLEWFKGSALRPYLNKLEGPTRDAFLADLATRFEAAYAPKGNVTLLPFPRIFFVATLCEDAVAANALRA